MSFLTDLLRRKPREASTAELRAFFNQAASSEEHYPSTIDPRIFHVKLVMEHMGDLSGKLVADVGCGKGRFARVIQEKYPTSRVCAIDIAEAMLAHVPKGIYRTAAAMTQLPLSSGSCDGAYATESLEHAVDIPKAVEELCRIVKPGGRIAIIDKDIKAWGRSGNPGMGALVRPRRTGKTARAAIAKRYRAARFPTGKKSSPTACSWRGWP